ncbi:MAG: hypothetical protein J6Y54_02690 [Lentisphaeria bacterium]|nr:hypothetical protein [Lentisphaeria bacterium]
MKKFFAALLVALFGAVPLFADDVADVKAVIVKDLELGVKGDFAGAFALYAPDFQEIDSDGMKFNYEQTKWLVLSLDGKHPEEFLLLYATYENKGAVLQAEATASLRQVARDPEFVKKYEEVTPQIVAAMKAAAALNLKTLEFVSVKVDGDRAVAVTEHDRTAENTGAIKRKIDTITLRNVDGRWMICHVVSKNK